MFAQLYLNIISALLQRLPSFRGKIRLGSFLISPWKNKKIEYTAKLPNKLVMTLPNLTETLAVHLFINGYYEPQEIKFINKEIKLNKHKVFLDIGANIGLFSLDIASNNPDVFTYAIEASPRVFYYLTKNINQNKLTNIEPVQTVLNDTELAEINFYSNEIAFGTGSLSPVFTKDAEVVSSTTIDLFLTSKNIEHIDIIKIDVEGYELQVFKGGSKLLNREKSPTILFEFVDWAEERANNKAGDAQLFLMNAGYKLYRLDKDLLIEMKECMKKGSATLIAVKN